jgi:4-deoxy-L-threo-5-hexosulose-uronate ketol-isomerase
MNHKHAVHPKDFTTYNTTRIREEFLIPDVMVAGKISLTYTHYDRFMVGGAVPTKTGLVLGTYDELKADFFLERREMGIINTGAKGKIVVEGVTYTLENKECLYIGKGNKSIEFFSDNEDQPALFYICSCPAHTNYPTTHYDLQKAEPMTVGSVNDANQRTIYKFIHLKGIKSCQLVMGMTMFSPGSIWNTMPSHVHHRRMEAYFYFDMTENARVMHFMGEPNETRHLVVKQNEAIVSPPWSIHSGAGTSSYSFIWAMAGENLDYTDMDIVKMEDFK